MRLRRLLATTAAILAATAAALATTTATAATPGGPITRLEVGAPGGSGPHNVTLTMQSWSMQIAIYGVNTTITCTYGSATGVAHEGTTNPYMTIKTLTLNCPYIFPSTTWTWSVVCDINIDYADNVHTSLVDTGTTAKFHRVAGVAKFTNSAGTHCLQVDVSNGCRYRIGNTSTAGFDEAVKPNGSQDLVLSGNSPQIKNPNISCLGTVSNNQAFTINAVFNVASPDGPIDFQN